MYPPLMEMHRRTKVTFLIALTTVTILSQSAGDLVIAPQNTESKVGDSTYLNCSTDLASVELFWDHGDKYIYNGHGILEPYNGRFEIDRNASKGSHNLVIHSVQPSDAGKYICADDDGSGTRRSAELIVLDTDLDCQSNMQPDGVIGQNIFNVPPDEVQLICSVTYHGSIPPQLQWMKADENSSIMMDSFMSTVRSANRLTHTLKFKGDISLDKSSFVCQTTRSTQNQYKCSSETVKVSYFLEGNTSEQSVIRGESITCIASNSTLACTSQWYHDNYTCPLSCDETITAHLLGEYLCMVKCHVRGKDYYFETMKVSVVEPIAYPLQSMPATIRAAVVVPIVIIITLVASILVLVEYCKRKKYIREFIPQCEDNRDFLSMIDYINRSEPASRNGVMPDAEVRLHCKVKKSAPGEEDSLKEKRIVAAATLRRELFIVRVNTSTIEIYDLDGVNFRQKLTVKVEHLSSAYDMCACNENICIYIMDNKKVAANKIIKIDTRGKIKQKWRTQGNAVGNLSATSEGNVILAVHRKNMLLEYSPEGKLKYEIDLPECSELSHAVKIDTDRFIVCHGTAFEKPGRVCIVEKEGDEWKVKTSSDGRTMDGSAEIRFLWPRYLAVGGNNCVIVADLCSSRLLLLDFSLKLKAKIVPKYKQKFRGPLMIFMDELSGLLGVVISGGGPDPRNDLDQEAEDGAPTENDDLLRTAEEGRNKIVSDTTMICHGRICRCVGATEIIKSAVKIGDERKAQGEDRRFKKDEKIDEDTHQITKGSKKMNEDSTNAEDTPKTYADTEKIDEDCLLLVFDINDLL